MAWASVGSAGTGTSNTADTTCVITSASGVAAGNVCVVIIAKDNTSTTDGNTNEVLSMTDSSGGNTWTKAREFTNGQAAANAGATVAIFYSVVTKPITAVTGTITATLAENRTAKGMTAWVFTTSPRAVISSEGTPLDLATDAATTSSIAMSGLPNVEYLFVRGTASELATAAMTVTANHTLFTNADGGGTTTAGMQGCGEWRILAATGDTSAPALTSGDHASTMIALRETPYTAITMAPYAQGRE